MSIKLRGVVPQSIFSLEDNDLNGFLEEISDAACEEALT